MLPCSKQDFRVESKSAFPLHGRVVMHVCYEVRIALITEPSGPDSCQIITYCTGRFIMFSVITDIHNKKTKGPTLMELFTATGKLKFFFFDN